MSSILDIFELAVVRMPIHTSTNAVICSIMQSIEIVFFFPRNYSLVVHLNTIKFYRQKQYDMQIKLWQTYFQYLKQRYEK